MLAENPELKNKRIFVTMISDYTHAYYSGMLPGCVSGLYHPLQLQMFLEDICKWVNVRFIHGRGIKLDPEKVNLFFQSFLYDIF